MKRFTPSPSMVVACIALCVALSGTAYAAAKINGKNIKKGTITSTQIKDKSILGKDIKDKTITGADIKDGAVGTADLADQAVDSAKVKDGSLGAGDLAAGTIVPPPIGTVTSTTAFSPPVGLVYTDVPGMALNYAAPAGTKKLILTFSAECSVDYTADAQFLAAQIFVNGSAAEPDDSANQFCTVDPLDNYAQVATSQFTRVFTAGPGTHAIKVGAMEALLSNGTLDNMTLTVTPSS